MRKPTGIGILAAWIGLILCSIQDSGLAAQPSVRQPTSLTGAVSCRLFADDKHDLINHPVRLDRYQSVLLKCRDSRAGETVAIRRFSIHRDPYYLTVNSSTLESEITRASCLSCEPMSEELLAATRFGQTLATTTAPPYPPQNDGLRESSNSKTIGSFLTGDLCPSHKSLDRAFFDEVLKLNHSARHPIEIALSVSGGWLRNHGEDLAWLKERIARDELRVVWINHSYSHPFHDELPLAENFLLRAGVNMPHEILDTEKAMISNGLKPSVFFRFPGLVSNEILMAELRRYHLIPVGASAWLAKNEKPAPGAIILIHPNGNEPYGLQKFSKLLEQAKLPLPLLRLTDAP
jgi:hypothetical protein